MLLKKDVTADRVASLLGAMEGAFLVKAPFAEGLSSEAEVQECEEFMERCFGEFSGTSIVKTRDGYLILSDQQLTNADGASVSPVQLVDHLRSKIATANIGKVFNVDGITLEKLGQQNKPGSQDGSNLGPCPEDFYEQVWWHRRCIGEGVIETEPLVCLATKSVRELRCLYPDTGRRSSRGPKIRDRYFELSSKTIGYDMHLLGEAVNLALDYTEKTPDLIIRSGINFEGFINKRSREIYLNELRQIPQILRDNIAVELVRVPDGTPAARISDVLSQISCFVSKTSVTVTSDWHGRDLTNFVGADEVCFVMPPYSSVAHQRAAQVGRLKELATQCFRHNIDLSISNIFSPELIQLAASVKAKSVSGPLLTQFYAKEGPQEKQDQKIEPPDISGFEIVEI